MHISVSCLIPKYIMQSCQNTSYAASTKSKRLRHRRIRVAKKQKHDKLDPFNNLKWQGLSEGTANLARLLLISGELSLKFRLKYSELHQMIGQL